MGFVDLPKGYNDKKETAKQLAILEFVHYAWLDENGHPAGKYYMTKDGHVLNLKEIDHLKKTGTFRRMKKWNHLRQPKWAYRRGKPPSLSQNPEENPKFREKVEKFITHYLEPWDITWIAFDKDLQSGHWDIEHNADLSEFDPRDVDASLEWFCNELDRFKITDYSLEEVGTAWQSASIRDGFGGEL